MDPKPKPETKKLCPHALSGGCHYGPACANPHPADVGAAKAEHALKKTLNLCGFHPGCTRPSCTWLHVDLLAPAPPSKAEAGRRAPASGAAGRRAPAAATPQKAFGAAPAGQAANRERRRDGRARRGRGRERSQDTLPALRTLDRVRGKIRAIEGVENANRQLAASLARTPAAADATLRARKAADMQAEIEACLQRLAAQLDSYISELGAAEEEWSEDEPVGSALAAVAPAAGPAPASPPPTATGPAPPASPAPGAGPLPAPGTPEQGDDEKDAA